MMHDPDRGIYFSVAPCRVFRARTVDRTDKTQPRAAEIAYKKKSIKRLLDPSVSRVVGWRVIVLRRKEKKSRVVSRVCCWLVVGRKK